jgi:hypothetical protein
MIIYRKLPTAFSGMPSTGLWQTLTLGCLFSVDAEKEGASVRLCRQMWHTCHVFQLAGFPDVIELR